MTKKQKRYATNQTCLDFAKSTIEAYSKLRDEILSAPPPPSIIETYAEMVTAIAFVVKEMIRDSGLSRDQVVDAINDFFHWPKNDKRKCLTSETFNNYLSKPIQYHMPAFIIVAVQHICHSLKMSGFMAELEGGKVITREEVRELNMGKLEKTLREMNKLKKQLIGGR